MCNRRRGHFQFHEFLVFLADHVALQSSFSHAWNINCLITNNTHRFGLWRRIGCNPGLNFSSAFHFPLKTHFLIITKWKKSQGSTTASARTRTNIASFAQLTRETNKPWCIANTMNHNAMQGIGDWALELETISFSNRTTFCYEVFCRLAKLIQVKSATLQRFQLAFKHLLLLEKNSRLHPIFQDFAFNFHTFSRSGKEVRKFPDFFKNSRLCTNPDFTIKPGQQRGMALTIFCSFPQSPTHVRSTEEKCGNELICQNGTANFVQLVWPVKVDHL